MARLAKTHVYAALERAAQNILSAAGADPFVSRRDIRNKLRELGGVEQQLTDIFYRFMDHRDSKPGARITQTDVDETLAYAKEKLVDAYDLNNNGFSKDEVEKMSLTGRLAVQFARILKAGGTSGGIETTEDILDVLKDLGEGLYFPAWANEADAVLKLFHREAQLEALTPETFSATLGLDPGNPAEEVYFFDQGRVAYSWIFDHYAESMDGFYFTDFMNLHRFMEEHLRDITHIIVGQDGLREDSEYPVYFVGLTPDGDIVGFETTTVWT